MRMLRRDERTTGSFRLKKTAFMKTWRLDSKHYLQPLDVIRLRTIVFIYFDVVLNIFVEEQNGYLN